MLLNVALRTTLHLDVLSDTSSRALQVNIARLYNHDVMKRKKQKDDV